MCNTINGWTKEKMIEQVKKEFKGQAKDKNTNLCSYRTEDGRKCAVGCFIPNSEYFGSMEEKGVDSLLEAFPSIRQYLPLEPKALSRFQDFHDSRLESDTVEGQTTELINWIETNVA